MGPIDCKSMLKASRTLETLQDLGEREILNRLKRFVPPGQLEDDTAEINPFEKQLLINTDFLVEGVHFSNQTTTPSDVGWKAVAANVSDLIGSGSDEILGLTIGLVAPPQTHWVWVEEVYEGISSALKNFGGSILGGDCSSGKDRLLGITAIGTLGQLRLHRSQAIAGDYLVVSGPHGLSRLGLEILLGKELGQFEELSTALKQEAILAHQRPQPPINALSTLKACKPKSLPWRAGGTDSSDGLIEALKGLCISSNCQAVIDKDSLPKANGWPEGIKWENFCLNGGEDFELVLSLPKSWANAWLKAIPSSQVIGFMQEGLPKIIWADSREEVKTNESFTHFSNN